MGSDDDAFVVHSGQEFSRMTIAAQRCSYEELVRLTSAVSMQVRMPVADKILLISGFDRMPNKRLQRTGREPVLVASTCGPAAEARR